MNSTTKTDNASHQDLVAELQRLYGKQHIQRDPFGRRRALPSEVARVVTQSESLRHRAGGAPAED